MAKEQDALQDVSETFLSRHSLSASDPQLLSKCSDDLFPILGVNFDYSLGISLGLGRADIEAIKRNNDTDQDRVVALLWKWKEIKGSKATYLALIESLLKCRNEEAAEKVIQYLKTKPTATPLPPSSIRSSTSPEFKTQLSLPSSPNQYPHESSCTRSISYPVEIQKRVRCEKNPNNKAWKILDRHHDHLVNIIHSDATLCNNMLNHLAESFLIGSAERDVIQQLSCLKISSKAMMRYLSTFISRARNPVSAFIKFAKIIQKFEAFRAVFAEMKSEASDVKILIGLPVKTTKIPVTISEEKLSYNFPDDTDSDVCKLLPIKSYSHHLKMCYKKDKPNPKWPLESAPSDVYVDLAVVKKDSCSDAFSKSTIRGTADDIFRLKEPLSIEELCNIEYGEAILIEGAPGIGKSMLAFEICCRWVNGEALKNYPLLLLLRLREKFIQKCKTVRELLGCFLKEQSWKDEAVQSIINKSGEGLIIIFEGFDELPKDLTKADSVFLKFSNELPCASLIYTSRPSAKHYLRQEISFGHHVEVIGFVKENIDQYIKKFFKYNNEHIAAFNQHLDESPKIRNCLYIPVNLIIICSILLQCITNKEQVPLLRGIVTSTKLYEAMIKMLLYRHIKSQNPGELVNVDLNDLPQPIKKQFFDLCQMAYDGLSNHTTELLFYPKGDFETLGMMQKEIQVYPGTGDIIAYSFLHLTIQEFLAAYHISQLPEKERQVLFNKFRNVMKLSTMLCFLAGLTELQSITPCVDEKLFSMTLFHCLYESGNNSLTRRLFCNTDEFHEVCRLLPLPTPQDMYILGRCIALSNCQWGLRFTLRGMTADYVEKFQRGLGFVESGVSCIIKEISFSLNPIGDEGVIKLLTFPRHILENLVSLNLTSCGLKSSSVIEIAKQFYKFHSLEMLSFHSNQLKEGEQLPLLKAITSTPLQYCRITFSKLSPEECSVLLTKSCCSINKVELYQLESYSIQSVIECLSESHSLQVLHIEQTQCTIENLCLLPTTLPFSSIKQLELINCAIDSNSVCTVIEAVLKSPHLETLNLQDNFIDDEGGTHLCAMLRRIFCPSKEPISSSRFSNKFKYLGIGHNPFKEPGISGFIKELAQFKDATFILSLSLGWMDFASTLNLFPKVKHHLKFECNKED